MIKTVTRIAVTVSNLPSIIHTNGFYNFAGFFYKIVVNKKMGFFVLEDQSKRNQVFEAFAWG